MPSSFTYSDILLDDTAQNSTTVCGLGFNASITFTAAACSDFTLTLTGNVTSSTVTGAVTGQQLNISLCQDATGSRTLAWPPSFTRPPTISATAGSCTNASFFFDGATWRLVSSTGDTLTPTSGGITGTWAGSPTWTGAHTFNGSITSTAANSWTGTNTFSGTTPIITTGDNPSTFGGTILVSRFEGDRIVDINTAGADWCAKVNNKAADAGSNARIKVYASANAGACTTPLVISQTGIAVMLQAGTWLSSAAITVSGQGSFIVGQPASVSPDCDGATFTPATIIKQATGANLATFLTFSGNASGAQDVVFDGNRANNITTVGPKITGSRVQFTHVTTCHFPSDGWQATSTITGTATNNEAINFRFIESSTNRNGGTGGTVTNTADFESRGSYYELNGSYGLRLIAANSCRITGGNDFGGNNNRGIYATGLSNNVSVTGSLCDVEGNQFGNNVGSDIYVDAYDSVNAGRSIQQWAVVGNTLAGLGASATPNTIDAIHFQDSGNNRIADNVIVSNSSPTNRYGIFTGNGTLTELSDTVGPNSYSGTFGTSIELLASTVVQGASNENGSGFGRMRNVYWANADNVNVKNAAGTVQSIWTPLNAGNDSVFNDANVGRSFFFQINGTTGLQVSATQAIAPQLVSNVAAGTAPLSATARTIGQDPVTNITLSNHPLEYDCGSTVTCSATLETSSKLVRGSAPLSSGTPSTATITALPFTGTNTYRCAVTNETTQANALKYVRSSASQIVITGPNTVTDTVSYMCGGT